MEIQGTECVTGLKIRDVQDATESVIATDGVFIAVGILPNTDKFRNLVKLDEAGYIVAGEEGITETPGIFAAGDIRTKMLRQVVTAVGDGATAATELEKYAAAMQGKTGIHPEKPIKKEAEVHKESPAGKETEGKSSAGIFSQDIINQLNTVFAKMERKLQLELHLDSRPVSQELENYMTELAKYTDKLTVHERVPSAETGASLPFVDVLTESGEQTGLAFHGVPGGHEFTSFILGLYNAAGPGQPLDPVIREKILAIQHNVHLQVLVSLSCTMCPDLVTAAQRIASLNPLVTAEVYDIAHFPDLKEKYHVMSVPCLIINQDKTSFGKKNIQQILELI